MKSGRLMNSTGSPRGQVAIASLAALVVGGVAVSIPPASLFQATAIVAVDEPSVALRFAAARSAAALAVSKPVIARAAGSLNGTVVSAPAPAFAEKLEVATGLVGATNAVTRLAEALVPTVSATAGEGLVEVQAQATDGPRAARVATALAEALVAEEEGSVFADARRREAVTAAGIETLRENASAAQARLAGLGGSATDPNETFAAAGAAARAAETRLAAVRAVIAAGSPPLGGGSELPQSVAALQQTYWDLKKQLDKASETLGERHTTVIALHDGVVRAAAALTAEWQRIERGAAGDVSVARSREAVLRRTALVADPVKRAAIDKARAAAHFADAALARAVAAPATAAPVNPPIRLVAPAAVPAAAMGLGPWQRGAFAGGAGLGAFALAWLAMRKRRGRAPAVHFDLAPAAHFDEPSTAPEDQAQEDALAAAAPSWEEMAAELRPAQGEPLHAGDEARPVASAHPIPATSEHAHVIARVEGYEQPNYDYSADDWHESEPEPVTEERIAAMPFESASFDAEPIPSSAPHSDSTTVRRLDPTLLDALRGIAADLEALAAGNMSIATVMVVANTVGADTGAVALALGEAAAELGFRVLVIEGERARPTLAEAVAPQGDPLLVDTFGALRVALPAERGAGLFLAPAFRDGARIAAALARNTQAELVDDLAAAFDAVVIDGGRAADSAAAGLNADAFIRVGRFASQKDDAYLLDAFGAPPEALLGTVAAGRFVAREIPPEPAPPIRRPTLRAVPASVDVKAPRRSSNAPAVPLRRRLVAR